ncbi:MAG: hypothetical protein Q9P44_03545 [Anaerolineae bacterium]|nr:hypothetical protein [Anaerolineae bacterium]
MLVFSATIKGWILCALILLIGALSACSATATPVVIPTLTLVPSTATATSTPITPSPRPDSSATPIPPTETATSIPIITILETTITPDADLTRRILRHLANNLNTDLSRIQIVSIEAATWFDDNLGCDQQTTLDAQEAYATFQPSVRVEGFRYVLLVGNTAHEYHSEGVQRFEPCINTERITGELLLAVDPIAVDILSLVQRQIANELDLSTRRVQLVEIVPYIWRDTSLGCPQANQSYTLATLPGYRIVVSAGDNDYAFHSDSTTAIRCPIGQEVLPN